MGVLDVEKPALMARDDVTTFDDAVGESFGEHAPGSALATRRQNHVVDLRPRPLGRRGSIARTL